MLVLTRKEGQSIIIGADIIVTVTQIRGKKVRIGITAPAHIQVWRKELIQKGKKPELVKEGAFTNTKQSKLLMP